MNLTRLLAICVWLVGVVSTPAESTINSSHSSAYGSNVGWINMRGNGTDGAILGEYVCSGNVWGANFGWVNLGDGTPANGIHYQNDSASDFGVNHDGLGNLRGYAYGANIGWIVFADQGAPRIDLATGQLSGHAWSANIGWISFSNAVAHVQTEVLQPGVDSDGDGITDAWELSHTNTLTAFSAFTDTDGDGVSDRDEHVADTDPLSATDFLRITDYQATFPGGTETDSLTWSSEPTRVYTVQSGTVLDTVTLWEDVTPLIGPEPGPLMTRAVMFPSPSNQRYFQVRAQKPLAP